MTYLEKKIQENKNNSGIHGVCIVLDRHADRNENHYEFHLLELGDKYFCLIKDDPKNMVSLTNRVEEVLINLVNHLYRKKVLDLNLVPLEKIRFFTYGSDGVWAEPLPQFKKPWDFSSRNSYFEHCNIKGWKSVIDTDQWWEMTFLLGE